MGEEFTPEELVILGETPEPKTEAQAPPEGEAKPPVEGEQPPAEGAAPPEKEPEHTEEEKAAAEKMGFRIDGKFIIDNEGSKIPLKRFREVYFKAQEADRGRAETERQFNLFRELGPDKFYELYPDRKPAGYQPAGKREAQPENIAEIGAKMGSMVVQGGPYNGQTLNEVFSVDPAYANALQVAFLEGQKEKVTSVQRQQEELRRESETEVSAFSDQLSTELFGKKSGELSREEEAKVVDAIQATLDWMAKTKRGAGIIADAYFLMNREGILKSAHEKGGKAALASLSKPAIPSVDTGSGKTVTGTEALESMTSDQLAAEVEKWPEARYMKFLKEAPQALRAKHPSLPWE